MENNIIFIYLIQLLGYIDVCLQNLPKEEEEKIYKGISKGLYETLTNGFFYTETGLKIEYDEHTLIFKGKTTDIDFSLSELFELVCKFNDTYKMSLFLKLYNLLFRRYPESIFNRMLDLCL